MKKIISFLLCIICVFSFSGCSHSTTQQDDVLVVYFSGTGNTQRVAEYIAEETNGDIFEIVPEQPYSSEDLDYTNDTSRVVQEYENEDQRLVSLSVEHVENWDEYDVVYIGYPIWWGIAAWPVSSFVALNDFTDKTVIPFCTSFSSGLGDSADLLEEETNTGNWIEGKGFDFDVDKEEVVSWIESLR